VVAVMVVFAVRLPRSVSSPAAAVVAAAAAVAVAVAGGCSA